MNVTDTKLTPCTVLCSVYTSAAWKRTAQAASPSMHRAYCRPPATLRVCSAHMT